MYGYNSTLELNTENGIPRKKTRNEKKIQKNRYIKTKKTLPKFRKYIYEIVQ